MYRNCHPGYAPIPTPVSCMRDDWFDEGWTLQPYVPVSNRNPQVIVGRNCIWLADNMTSEITNSLAFRKAPLGFGSALLIGTVTSGYRRKEKVGHVVVHDLVSRAPLEERMEKLRELVKASHPNVSVSLPGGPGPKGATEWLAKRNSAAVQLSQKSCYATKDWVRLNNAQALSV
tara:strand:- start:635 stop:1156 length:522 start_codon:yes stop_codon:yes gene_type:complete